MAHTLSADKTDINVNDTVTFTVTNTDSVKTRVYIGDTIVDSDSTSTHTFTYTFNSVGQYIVQLKVWSKAIDSWYPSDAFVITVTEKPTGSWTIGGKTVKSLTIGNKEIQTITRVSDGAILYQKSTSPTPTPASISVTATKDVLSKHHSDTSTLTATVLDEDNNACVGETVTFKNGSTVLGTDTTDANGQAEYTYSSTGGGNITITIECASLTQTYNLEDIHYADIPEHSLTRSGTTIAGRINNDTFTLPSSCEITFDIFCDTNVPQGSEDRFFITDLGHLSTTGQPSQGVYVGYNRPSNMEYGYRNNSTSWYLYSIAYQNNWISCKIVRSTSNWSYYFNGTLASTKTYSGLNSYSSFVFNIVMWANSTMKIKNIKIKAV